MMIGKATACVFLVEGRRVNSYPVVSSTWDSPEAASARATGLCCREMQAGRAVCIIRSGFEPDLDKAALHQAGYAFRLSSSLAAVGTHAYA